MQRLTLETREKREIGALLDKNLRLCVEMQSARAYGAISPDDRSQSTALQVYYRDHNGGNERGDCHSQLQEVTVLPRNIQAALLFYYARLALICGGQVLGRAALYPSTGITPKNCMGHSTLRSIVH